MFLNSLNIHATRLLDKVSNSRKLSYNRRSLFFLILKIEAPNLELMPSVEFQKTLALVKEIFDSYNTSVVSLSSKKGDYDQVYYIFTHSLSLSLIFINFRYLMLYWNQCCKCVLYRQ
jgi:hypothetical protein